MNQNMQILDKGNPLPMSGSCLFSECASRAQLSPSVRYHMDLWHGGSWLLTYMPEVMRRQLTKALLHKQYGISWWVPDGHLIPPVTNRANYIHWLHDLLRLCPGQPSQATPLIIFFSAVRCKEWMSSRLIEKIPCCCMVQM